MTVSDIKARTAAAEALAGRPQGSVSVIAVSKVQPLDRVVAVLEAGHRVFGENYVQEAEAKWPDLRARFGAVELHMIGPLQSNKAKPALVLFDAIHTLDRASLADRLARLVQERGHCPQVFVQVNTGAEPQKAGVLPAEVDAFVAYALKLDLRVAGLMCIPPESQDSSPHFAMLAKIAARNGLHGLSMGMSADFEAAILHGATHIRVGSAIFGDRSYL